MKASITFFITVLLAPVINLQAQTNSNVNNSYSYPQTYFVRTVSGHGIVPETSIEVTDIRGRSISCKARDIAFKDEIRQYCKTDSLIKSLETCTTCKIGKIREQLDALYNAMKLGKPECASGYGVPVYAMYTKKADGSLHLINKVAKGCGKTDNDNKLIDDFIREFEKPGDKNLLIEQHNAASAKKSKPVSDSTDKNFVQQAKGDSANAFEVSARITTDGMLRLISKDALTGVEVGYYKPGIVRSNGRSLDFSPGNYYSRIYKLRKNSGSDLYDIDINDQSYKQMYKLVIIPVTDTGKKPGFTLINSKVPMRKNKKLEVIDYPVKN